METDQLLLPLAPNVGGHFDNYFGRDNQITAQALRTAISEAGKDIYLSGPSGSGKSHLLTAAAQLEMARGGDVAHVPLGRAELLHVALLDGLEDRNLVCIDDLQCIASNGDWEEAVFHLINRCRAASCRLVIAAGEGPKSCGFQLPDLVSRLSAMVRLGLQKPDDADKRRILQGVAQERGFELPQKVTDYLMKHGSRHLPDLLAALGEMETRAARRKNQQMTLPLARRVLKG